MTNYFQIIGISLQTLAGLIFIIEQISRLDKTEIINKITLWFGNLSNRLSVGTEKPQKSLVIFSVLAYIITVGILLRMTESSNSVNTIAVDILGLFILAALSYSFYDLAITSVLSLFFTSERRPVFKSPLYMSRKRDLKFETETRYFWNVNRESKEYKCKYNLANLIIFLICFAEICLAFFSIRASALTNRNLTSTILFVLVLFVSGVVVPVLFLTFFYLLGLVILCCTKFILKIWWIFLVFIWLSGGVFLIISTIYH